ncbi:gliding motility-associated C-terminal domain-containing protein [Paraflavitalea speifideaquila]|uniref:T9SS type B sorting domain-containing protein n=1 Tax=Paraflavitalea speifideaquila TaxID=3076558 RepID=UPI0028E344A7|nr:gliding motility-associated C-terminal domain-containing protein [Paraflavitalea speifideiaquila]
MVVFNRWGNKVFERYDFPARYAAYCWDGKMNGIDQPIGTYVYYVELQCPKGDAFIKKGTVTLIR